MSNSYINPLYPTYRVGQQQRWTHLHGSSLGLTLSQLAQTAPFIVITPDSLSAYRLIEEIQFYAPKHTVPLLNFPDWETLPYDLYSPHQDIISERLITLYRLPDMQKGVLVLPITTLMYRLPPTDYIKGNTFFLQQGQWLDPHQLRLRLENSSYRCVNQVEEHGEFTIRGSLIDLFPMGSRVPYRIDLLDQKVDSIRIFNPETQRTKEVVNNITLLPAREFPLTPESISIFHQQWGETFTSDPKRCPIYQDVRKGLAPAGIEYYLPLFFPKTQSLFDYLPPQATLITLPQLNEIAEQFWQDIHQRYEQLCHNIERPLLAPTQLFLQAEQIFTHIRQSARIKIITTSHATAFTTQIPPLLPINARDTNPLAELTNFIDYFQGRILLTAETIGRRETLIELFHKYHLSVKLVETWEQFLHSSEKLCLTVAPLVQGLVINDTTTNTPIQLALITETQLFGERVAQRRLRKKGSDTDAIIKNLTELTIGAPVVHEEYGVGRYLGLVTLTVNEIEAEFLLLEYANQDKLYVPATSLQLISRFAGVDPEHAPLHRLGSGQWEKVKRKAAQQVSDIAVELLDIYARRALRQGTVFQFNNEEYQAFAATFPFEETPDQQEAINAVLTDLRTPRPMDRLICGDVGFGKTEVAMRAAFIVANSGKQVAILAPTTLLVQQHYQNFQDRFTDWAIQVEQLSRFRSAKQQKEILQYIADGKVDIIIGTHKLLQDSLKFHNLGLVIIDEEHRFGVKQKEQFKSLRAEIDVLTLTATPIPRSLSMSLSNLRDLSIIATPPSRRLAIKTFVHEWHTTILIEAITRELRRGGQVYFLHNDIDSIEKMTEELQLLIPQARVHFAHGQMRERELEQVMQDFYHRRFNVLVCTTIIETGIDIPTANTIIINRADKFGLAQLYQLRGRVGRSHHRAYAYLIVPPQKLMTKDAIKRLEAISALEELGMGFTLATHDLEIRGAGELLGSEQSGHLQEIGYTLYTELLERAVTALQTGKSPELDRPLKQGTEIDLHISALLPNDYIPDIHTRLILYKRIANASDNATLDELQEELIDRFGLLPAFAKNLFKINELKLLALPLGIRKINLGEQGGYLLFNAEPQIDVMKLVKLVQEQPKQYQFDGKDKLHILGNFTDFSIRGAIIEQLLLAIRYEKN